MLSVIGPIILLVLIVAGFLRARMARGRTESVHLDGIGIEGEADAGRGRTPPPNVLPSLRAMVERIVLPRFTNHPDWERLDGAYGVPGRPIAQFEHNGTLYSINGESQIAALIAMCDWMEAHPGEDPLVIQPTKRGAGRLTLRPEIGWADSKAVRIETA
jgi:hypothetical protein